MYCFKAAYLNTCLLALGLSLAGLAASQDTAKARQRISALCSEKYHGRGYYKNGAVKAGKYISTQMRTIGLRSYSKEYKQAYSFPINTITKDPVLQINSWKPQPGKDFIVSAGVPASQIHTDPGSNNQVVWVRASNITDSAFRMSCLPCGVLHFNYRKTSSSKAIVYLIDTLAPELEKQFATFLRELRTNANTITFRKAKLTWSASPVQESVVAIEALLPADKSIISGTFVFVKWEIYSTLKKTNQNNIVGFIPGTVHADSFLVVTAHYDHLGRMGKSSVFPGANDNAAGIAMLLDLAAFYTKNPPKFSMVFIAFSGEEAGLIGSSYYVKNPLHRLANTRFLLNCDLVGTGETGITVVNATIFKNDFRLLDSVNLAKNYLPAINKRGKAANSDHYFFSELGIPAFFWYQGGPRTSYHDIHDIPETLSLAGYLGTFHLAVDFFRALGN